MQTDSHSYLEFNSCHQPHNKISIPFSQFLRIRRNCTEQEDFVRNDLMLSIYFSIRGYSTELVSSAFKEVCKPIRNDTLKEYSNFIQDDNQKKLFLILDCNPSISPIKEWLEELWPVLYKSSGTRILVNAKPIIGYRIPKDLQDILVSSNLKEVNWFGSENCN